MASNQIDSSGGIARICLRSVVSNWLTRGQHRTGGGRGRRDIYNCLVIAAVYGGYVDHFVLLMLLFLTTASHYSPHDVVLAP